MPYAIRTTGSKWEVYNTQTGRVAGTHGKRSKAKRQLAALYANVPDAGKIYNPAERRERGRFAPGQVTEGRPSGSGRGGRQTDMPAKPVHPATAPINAWIPARNTHGHHTPGQHQEHATRASALRDLAQAREIAQQIRSLREQLLWDRQMVAFLNGTGPFPTARRSPSSAGGQRSASVPGAQSGTAAQRQQRSFTQAQNVSFARTLRGQEVVLRQEIRRLEDKEARLRDRGNDMLDSISSKSAPIPDITLTARALQDLQAHCNV